MSLPDHDSNVPPWCEHGPCCTAEERPDGEGYCCNAAAGHDGPHAAYGIGGAGPFHVWQVTA